jgi:hypothetical protein
MRRLPRVVLALLCAFVVLIAPGLYAQQQGPPGYTFCAGEDYTCSFTGTKTVAYGAGSTFVYRTITNGTQCGNNVFGDPAPGIRKACYTQDVRTGGATGGGQGASQACRITQRFNQPEKRDPYGRILVEAAVINVLDCAGTQFYVYQYVNRPGFRTIRPPDWGHAIGGRDFSTFAEAVAAAAAASGAGSSSSGGTVSATGAGTWGYATDANLDGLTTGQLSMTEDANGRLTGTFQNNGGFDGEVNGNHQGSVVTLNIHPKGWQSDFVVQGRLVNDGGGLRIVGPVDHYGKKANITIRR